MLPTFQLEVRTDSSGREGGMTRQPVAMQVLCGRKPSPWPFLGWLIKADKDLWAEDHGMRALLLWPSPGARGMAGDLFQSLLCMGILAQTL